MKSRALALILLVLCTASQADEVVRVSTARDLVMAIEPNRTIVLEPGEYFLSEAEGIFTEHVAWEEVYDGQELQIHDVFDLRIRGEQGATLLAEPRYSFVLSFIDSVGVTLEDLYIGHTEAGYCSGGVVRLWSCEQVDLSDCGLSGSGTVGMEILDSAGIRVRDTLIEGCTYGALYIEGSENILFLDCAIVQNEAFALIEIFGSGEIVFEDSRIEYNYADSMFRIDPDCYRIAVAGVVFEGNEALFFAEEGGLHPALFDCTFTDNYFADQSVEEIEVQGD